MVEVISSPNEINSQMLSHQYSDKGLGSESFFTNYKKQQQQLLEASKHGVKEEITKLLSRRTYVNCKDMLGYSPLMWAVHYNHYDVCVLLLENVAQVNCRSKGGASPLHIAASFGHLECVKLLLTYGADVNFKDNNGDTPLHMAATMGKIGAAGVLLDSGCKPNLSNHDGCIPLHVAAERGWVEMVILLLGHGADVNRSNVFGWVSLHFAASKGHAEVLKVLLDYGANTQYKNRHGHSAFDLCTARGFTNCANLLQDRELSITRSPVPSPVKSSRPEIPLLPIPTESNYEDLFFEPVPVSTPRRRLQLVPEVAVSQSVEIDKSAEDRKLSALREEYEKIIKGQRNELQSLRTEAEEMHQAHIRETEARIALEREKKEYKEKAEELMAQSTRQEAKLRQLTEQIRILTIEASQAQERTQKYRLDNENLIERIQKMEVMYKQLNEDYNRDKHQNSLSMQQYAKPEAGIEVIEKTLDGLDMLQLRELESKLHHLLVKIGDAKLKQLQIQNENQRKQTERMKLQIDQLAQSRLCKVCEEKELEIVLLPCAHVCLCLGCSERLTNCPICRVPIRQRLKMYQS